MIASDGSFAPRRPRPTSRRREKNLRSRMSVYGRLNLHETKRARRGAKAAGRHRRNPRGGNLSPPRNPPRAFLHMTMRIVLIWIAKTIGRLCPRTRKQDSVQNSRQLIATPNGGVRDEPTVVSYGHNRS